MIRMPVSRTRGVQWLLLCGVVAAIYWPVVPLSFVGDDYDTLYKIVFDNSWWRCWAWFREASFVIGYRPLGDLYFQALYQVFGLHAAGYHVCALLIHATSSLFVLILAERLLGDRALAWAAGVVYAASAQVHGTPLSWMTGIYDVGGAFLCLACILLYLNRRPGASAVVYGLALLTKPSTVFLPLVLMAHGLFVKRAGWRELFRRSWLHGVIFCGYALWFCAGACLGRCNAGPVYRMSFSGMANLAFYGRVLAQAVVPCPEIARLVAAGLALCLAGAWVSAGRGRRPLSAMPGCWGFWIVWLAAALVPPLGFPNACNAYYLTYAWVPWVMLLLVSLRALAARCRCGRKLFVGLLAAVAACAAAADAVYFTLPCGLESDGCPGLAASARSARRVWLAVSEQMPRMPRGAVLIFEGDRRSTLRWMLRLAPRIWCDDQGLLVGHVETFCPEPGNLYLRRGIDPVRLGEKNDYIRVWIRKDGRVVVTPMTLAQVYALRTADARPGGPEAGSSGSGGAL